MLDSMRVSPIAQYSPTTLSMDVGRHDAPVSRRTLATAQLPLSQRMSTYPPHTGGIQILKKRIVVCCDGTWQDGIIVNARWKYTNVLRLARAVRHVDARVDPPVPQVVFYQSGIGSANNIYSHFIDGATGASLAEKVEEAYAFITQNYHPGDEILLFGFSRGAYTARMIASLIGKIGVLSRTEMDHFSEIYIALQQLGSQDDLKSDGSYVQTSERKKQLEILAKWTGPDSPGCKRAKGGPEGFSVKCVGVFDTVGSVGLPEEITRNTKMKKMFGFQSTELGPHIQKAYQALALNERRADFNCAKFEQTEAGRKKNQVLRQCWFTGCHSDIGGGYPEPDLANLTLAWMAAHIEDIICLDTAYLASLVEAVEPWGKLSPHDSCVGVFEIADRIQRQLPTEVDDPKTHEAIHPSVLQQTNLKDLTPELDEILNKNPSLVCKLLPLEDELRKNWKVTGTKTTAFPQPLSEAIKVHIPEAGDFRRWLGTILSRSRRISAAAPRLRSSHYYYGGAIASSLAAAYYYCVSRI
ncbi:hypothetical protein DAEQUDRAFT_722452 [Daedalea quercina L-15889]|uniref:T6SS Phospholipase effector Tle1-like catalytic domain-containing protein n=1 Tax=Daedalea quercina L-15889 TaxID=1314783 RepID=A0A165T2N3_9APHY|nr:hypothetical protein DAEQUDRAFT_722452 [Daedalea quercina L-15889]